MAVVILVTFFILIAIMLGPMFGVALVCTLILVGSVYVIVEWITEAQEVPYDEDQF